MATRRAHIARTRAPRPKAIQSVAAATRAPRRVDPTAAPTALPDPQLASLTAEILRLLATAGEQDVGARVQIGRLLLRVRHRLAHGEWAPWLARHVPFTRRTAERAVQLFQFSGSQPRLYQALAPLGVAKVNVLITMSPAAIQQLIDKLHRIPSTGITKPLTTVTFAELMEIIAAQSGPPDQDAATALLNTYKNQVRALVHTLDTLIAHKSSLPPDQLEELHDDLLEAAARFAIAFGIDDD